MTGAAPPAVGVLVVAHAPLADALCRAAAHVVGEATAAAATALDVAADEPAETTQQRIARALAAVDAGAGVLILLDVAGASPANAALAAAAGTTVACVAGASLPMLLRVYNYREAGLVDLAEIAVAAGQRHALSLSSPADPGIV